MASQQPRIAIIGGGPAGLTLGNLLHNRQIPFTIYELRSRPTDDELSQPSGVLDLHDESGQAAIRECGLHEAFVAASGDCTESMVIADHASNVIYTDAGFDSRPEITRHALTRILLSRLPQSSIKWGQKLLEARLTADGTQATLTFAGNHQMETFDLVVGADGAWSKIRPLLSDVKPVHAGTQAIILTITDISTRYPQLADLVGTGSMFALGTHNGLVSHRSARDSSRMYACISHPDTEHTAAALAEKTIAEAKELLLTDRFFFGAWTGPVRDLLSTACDEEMRKKPQGAKFEVKSLYVLPVAGHKWTSRPCATLIGDAAHLMPPWAGEGVNLAMWDALDLSRVIAAALDENGNGSASGSGSFRERVAERLAAFEKTMCERAGEKAEQTDYSGKIMFGPDGAQGMADLMRSFGPPPLPESLQ